MQKTWNNGKDNKDFWVLENTYIYIIYNTL